MEFTGKRYTVSRPAVITPAVVESARRLSHDTPQPQQTRLVGKLDMIRDSTNSFAIKLKDGQEVRGVLTDGEIAKVTATIWPGSLGPGEGHLPPIRQIAAN